jgi:hypothetical protein
MNNKNTLSYARSAIQISKKRFLEKKVYIALQNLFMHSDNVATRKAFGPRYVIILQN